MKPVLLNRIVASCLQDVIRSEIGRPCTRPAVGMTQMAQDVLLKPHRESFTYVMWLLLSTAPIQALIWLLSSEDRSVPGVHMWGCATVS